MCLVIHEMVFRTYFNIEAKNHVPHRHEDAKDLNHNDSIIN
jgi:hypothetical protein